MSKRLFGLITSASFFGVALLFSSSSMISENPQTEYVALSDEAMLSLFGGACAGNTGTVCTRGNKVQDWKGTFIDCTNCAPGEKSFKPEIFTCHHCGYGDTKYIKISNLCVETKSKCSTHGYPAPEEG